MERNTLKAMEELIRKDLLELENLGPTASSSDEEAALIKRIEKLSEVLTQAELANAKAVDDAERRRIDEVRNENMVQLEKQKQKMDWKRWALEVAKIVFPVMAPLVIWRKSFVEMIRFEETGRFTSSASKELRLPKIFNNK